MNFYKYVWAAFGVLIIIWAPVTFIFGFGGLIMMMIAKDGAFLLGLLEIGIVIFPFPLMFLAYLAHGKAKSVLVQWFILYGFWFLVCFIGLYVLLAALGGSSMAAVENAHGWALRNKQYLEVVTRWMLLAQPFIVGLSFLGLKRLKEAEKEG